MNAAERRTVEQFQPAKRIQYGAPLQLQSVSSHGNVFYKIGMETNSFAPQHENWNDNPNLPHNRMYVWCKFVEIHLKSQIIVGTDSLVIFPICKFTSILS